MIFVYDLVVAKPNGFYDKDAQGQRLKLSKRFGTVIYTVWLCLCVAADLRKEIGGNAFLLH